ncbi:MAG: FeoB-associated Cys-rich membrane protein [Acutalibacteraceae bacterium]
MLSWISENTATIIITVLLIAAVIGIIIAIRKDKKNGKCSCGGSCGHCPMSGSCHKE